MNAARICDVEEMPVQSAAFRRGAVAALAAVSDADVIATSAEPVIELPATSSSEVCRILVMLPIVDVSSSEESVSGLCSPSRYDPANLDALQKRLWATLFFFWA